MEEQGGEIEKIAEAEALNKEVAEARCAIEQEMRDPAAQSAAAAGEVGMVQEMWNVLKKHGATTRELAWKDAKAMGMGALSFIPLIGEAGTVAKIGSAVEAGKKVAAVEGATWAGKLSADLITKRKFGKGIAVSLKIPRGEAWKKFGNSLLGIAENPVRRYLAHPLGSSMEAGKAFVDYQKKAWNVVNNRELKAAKKLFVDTTKEAGKNIGMVAAHGILHKLDPFPDVPPALTTVAGIVELVLPGTNVLPAIWQLAHNKIEWAKMYGGLALDMGSVVMKRFDGKLNEVKKPDVMQASAVFARPAVA